MSTELAVKYGTSSDKKSTATGGGGSTASLIAIGNVNNRTSPYYMDVPIPEAVSDGLVVISYTRDSNQPFDSVSSTTGTAVLEDGTAGKYQYTNAFLNTYAIRISNVYAGSTVTVMRTSNGANFYWYVVYKFS